MSSVDQNAAKAALARLRDNAFYVLELPAACSRIDVERQGQKLLAMLEKHGMELVPEGPKGELGGVMGWDNQVVGGVHTSIMILRKK